MSIWIGFLKGDCREGILTKKKKKFENENPSEKILHINNYVGKEE
jgi:hypothetical protein